MNTSIRNYYLFNQFLNATPFNDAIEGISIGDLTDSELKELESSWSTALLVKPTELSELEEVFLRLMRIQSYDICLPEGANPMYLSDVAALCREHNLPVDKCAYWAQTLLSEYAVTTSKLANAPISIIDGVLRCNADVLGKEGDLGDNALLKASTLFVWGTLNENKSARRVVSRVIRVVGEVVPHSFKNSDLVSLVSQIAKYKLSVIDLKKGCLRISNLKFMYKQLGCVAWYTDISNDSISILVPVGNKSTSTMQTEVLSIRDFLMDVSSPDGVVASARMGMSVE